MTDGLAEDGVTGALEHRGRLLQASANVRVHFVPRAGYEVHTKIRQPPAAPGRAASGTRRPVIVRDQRNNGPFGLMLLIFLNERM